MLRLTLLSCLTLAGLALAVPTEPPAAPPVEVNTFSICAYDPDTKQWGVGVASKVLAVGVAVPFLKAEVGAIATQALVNVDYGPDGLKLLAEGKSAEDVVKALTEADKGRDVRQLGIVDAQGNAAHFTGKGCNAYAGAKSGKHYTCQGNLLAGEAVITDMAKAFEEAKGPLAWRIMSALEAAEAAGGDKRGKQSAAIVVVKTRGGWGGKGDRMIDLRVDDHESPITELDRLLTKAIGKRKKME